MRTDEKPSWPEHLTRMAIWFTVGALVAVGILLFAEKAGASPEASVSTPAAHGHR